jgi:creatinine amidohydrolase
MASPWDLASANLHQLTQHQYEVAVLPVGATEAHNRHLPEGQDFLVAGHIARRCCAAAWKQCRSVLCLPAMPYGVDCNLMAFPFTLHVSQAALDAVVRSIILAVRKHGIRKVVLINGHGGNDFMPLIRALQSETDVHTFLCNWWTVGSDRYDEIFDRADDHAGQMETSVALAVHPERVELEVAGDGQVRPYRFEALRRGWMSTSRDFARLNDHCGVGDPSGATAERGRRYLDLVCERITSFLVELAQAPIDAHFPHVPGR